ncbi:Protein arginine N-methyltransferase [Musa troglodytarum]|uniref:Protein arginine N-methyltransferase 7 n=1 Tax=Musa troglodytarum TaxID=320322 RepID=A0A9E7GX50_9LILI|nr:Protein arginine N-methyltransferase [Musa troglodytarum]URE19677.1 Protein arginine N-methyltransferase [Musa troglodytarum]
MSATTACPKTRAFQLRVNPLTGDSEWIVVEEGGDREELEEKTSKNLLATTSYLDMLNDSYRNWAFRAAIEKTIKKPCHVLDIGAGTGLLSMMAARTMAKFEEASEAKVSACESYLPMGKLMRRVLRKNQMEKKVSEILDSELLGEGLIPTLQQAHDMLLAKNPQTVPYRATTYGQLVESPFLWKLHDLFSNEINLSDGIHLTPAGLERVIGIKKQQYVMHCTAMSREIRLLSEPFKIFEFDFWKKPESHGEIEMSIKACSDGNVIAVISWWVLQLDEEGSIFYSTAPRWTNCPDNGMVENCIPGNENWCDHWKQCVWFISGAGLPVLKDKLVLFKAAYDEIKISYHLKCDDQTCCNNFNFGNCLLELSPERVAVYGDKDWRSGFINAMRNTLNVRSAPLCIIADDSVFLTILISYLSKNANTISSFPGLQEKGAQYLQAIADSNGFSMDRVKVIGKRASYLLTDNLIQQKVDFLVGEPFYYGNEGALPWQNLRFWKERTLLDSILSEDVVIMPCKGILKVCAMSLPDLWRSRCSLKKVEGFDHSVVNETLGACGNLPPLLEGPCLPYYIWQCGEVEELSEILPLMEFNFLEPIHACSRKIKIEFSKLGICHGFALWIDWVLDNKKSLLVSTGPISRYWKQGVKLLSKPLAVNAAYSFAEIEAFFDHSSGEITISSFSPS